MRKRHYAAAFTDRNHERIAQQLRDCQETEVLACCSSCGKSWYILNKCRLRVCPLCSYQVSQERAAYLEAMTMHMEHPKMITLTQPLWTEDPHDGIKHLRKSFNKLRRARLFKPVRGGAYTIEVKQKANGWHIHMHCLLDAPFIPYQKLFTAWKKIIGANAPQIDIQAATSARARKYICKYTSKGADFDTNVGYIVNWYEATKGERLFTTFGTWYNAKMEDLDKEHVPFKPEAKCPHCDDVQSTYLARDGPFIYGWDDWRKISSAVVDGQDETRPIPGANAEVTDKERPAERVERLLMEKERAQKTTHPDK